MKERDKVFLAMPGSWAEDNREMADHYTTKIGGVPDWPSLNIDHAKVKCRLCGERLYLVAQVYAPISSDHLKVEDRTVYVLGCPRTSCATSSEGWRALRVQKNMRDSQHQSVLEPQKKSLTCDNWWASGTESDDEIDLQKLSEEISEASRLAQGSKKQNEPIFSEAGPKIKPKSNSSDIPVLPCFYVYDEEEKFFDKRNDITIHCSSLSIKENPSLPFIESSDEEKWEGESYEHDRALGADRVYLKFKKRIEAYPEQCIRYSHGGMPLVAAELLEKPMKCESCGAHRNFEMQLMPPLLFFLQQAAEDQSAPGLLRDWTWMTVIIYTCSQNCSRLSSEDLTAGDTWVVSEESVVVQWE
ncbi:programmed cell death 2 C-terminal domain-containing protein [Wolffia australiana]